MRGSGRTWYAAMGGVGLAGLALSMGVLSAGCSHATLTLPPGVALSLPADCSTPEIGRRVSRDRPGLTETSIHFYCPEKTP